MLNPYQKFEIDEKTGNYPHPNTARTPEEFREIMAIRGYTIAADCPFFYNKTNSQSSSREVVLRPDANGEPVLIDLTSEYREACTSFFDKMRKEGYIKEPTENKSLTWDQFADKLRTDLKLDPKANLEKEFLHHLKQQGMLGRPTAQAE